MDAKQHTQLELRSRLWDYLSKSLTTATAQASESSCKWELQPELPRLHFGFEASSYDLGMDCSEDTVDTDVNIAGTDRLQALVASRPSSSIILGMELKHMNTLLCKIESGGLYFFHFWLRPSQDKCSIVIITNPSAPHLAASVPVSFLKCLRQYKKEEARHYTSAEAPLISSVVPPFPIELSPFVLPANQLNMSLSTLLAFARGHTSIWFNPYNKIRFPEFKISALVPAERLFADPVNDNRDETLVQQLRDACKSVCSEYNVLFPDIHACGGDVIVTHDKSDSIISLELKKSSYRQTRVLGERLFMFTLGASPTITWDAIMFTHSEGKSAMVIAKDEFPLELLQHHRFADTIISVKRSEDFWEKRTFQLPTGTSPYLEQLGRNFVRVFDFLRKNELVPSKKPAPLTQKSWSSRILDGPRYSQSVYDRYFTKDIASLKIRGEGRQRSPMLIEASRAMEIDAQCRQSGFGNLFRLGTHPSGTYIFCDGPYTGEKNTSFYDLDLETPMLFLNFAEVDHLGRYHPHDDRACLSFIHSTHGRSKSIYVIQTRTRPDDPTPPLQYLVPSATLATADRIQVNNEFINNKKKPREVTLYLSSGESLDCYRTPRGDTSTGLRRILRQCALAEGDVQIGRGVKVAGQEYVITRRSAMEQFLDVHLGRLPWKKAVETEEDEVRLALETLVKEDGQVPELEEEF